MANNPSFSFYVNDFEGGTRHMTDEELGCYVRLLLAQFNRGGILPNNTDFLRRFCTSFDKSWAIVGEKFIDIGENKIQNQRLKKETSKRSNFIEKQVDNGRRGGRPKTQSKPKNNPNKTQTKTQKKPLGNGYGIGKGEKELDMGTEEATKIPRISMPFNGKFHELWEEWKKYKFKQHDFKYKSDGSEQAALHELTSLAGGNEELAIAIIQQSMAKGWKGLFPIKNNLFNGKSNSSTTNSGFSREGVQAELAKRIKERQQG
jgi:uncharacterized protein YdaU (DUF1376 family)